MFDTVAEAHQFCPYDQIVWASPSEATVQRFKAQSKNTKGGYICKQFAIDSGYGGLVTHIAPLNKP